MPAQVAGVTVCKAGPIRNDHGTILGTNSTANSNFNSLGLTTAQSEQVVYGSKLSAAVSPNSSGNVGTQKLYNHLAFAFQQPGKYIISRISDSIAGSGNGLMQTMSTGPVRPIHRFSGYQRLHITSITMQGVATKGSQAGVTIAASGLDGTTGQYADHSTKRYGVPAELTFMTGNLMPSGMTYKVATAP